MKFYKALFPLQDARRNPELNPKVGAYEFLLQYKDDPDVYISFTDLDKIGINPRTRFATPLGIYTYPLKEFWREYVGTSHTIIADAAPFAGNADYINVIKIKNSAKKNFLYNMETDYTDAMYFRDMKILKRKYDGQVDVDSIIQRAIHDAKESSMIMHMWNVTRYLAYALKTKQSVDKVNVDLAFNPRFALKWSHILFKDLGYKGFADRTFKGYIHENEPMQAVFLDPTSYTVIERIVNKDYMIDPIKGTESAVRRLLPAFYDFFNEPEMYVASDQTEVSAVLEFINKREANEAWEEFDQFISDEGIDMVNSYYETIPGSTNLKIVFAFDDTNVANTIRKKLEAG